MKYKKYLLTVILIMTLFVGIDKVLAATYDNSKTCYYKSDNLQVYATISYNSESITGSTLPYGTAKAYLYKFGDKYPTNERNVANWGSSKTIKKVTFDRVTIGIANGTPKCPNYMLVVKNNGVKHRLFIDNMSTITTASATFDEKEKEFYYAKNVSSEDFWGTKCNGKECVVGENATIDCESLFGSSEDGEESLGSMINTALKYVQIIVPILIILLGSLDFAKAVIASKEDEMKKAQTTFIKRILAGIAVFFVPLLVNLVMRLADIVWENEYTTCEIKELDKY